MECDPGALGPTPHASRTGNHPGRRGVPGHLREAHQGLEARLANMPERVMGELGTERINLGRKQMDLDR